MEKEFKTKLQHTNWEWFSKSIYQKHEVQFTPMHKWHIVSEATSDNCPEKLETGNRKPRFQRHPEPEVARRLGGASKSRRNRGENALSQGSTLFLGGPRRMHKQIVL